MGDDFAAAKKTLRAQVIARRDAMDPAVRAAKSTEICARVVPLIEMHFASNSVGERPLVALFSALGSEIDLRDVVRAAADLEWRVALPVMLKEGEPPVRSMVFVEVSHETALQRQEDFMVKPAKFIDAAAFDFERFPLVPPERIDAMVLPLVAFDGEGGRLGYGGGNYDRYIPQLRDDCWMAGVAFEEQRVDRVPRAQFDVALPGMITA